MRRARRANVTRGGRGRGARRGRRGMTLLETVLAVAMMAMVSAAMFQIFDTVTRASIRQERRLAASELANRLILIYLDDPDAMPPKAQPLAYGDDLRGDTYRWEVEEQDATLELSPGIREMEEDIPALEGLVDRGFKQLKVRVWLSEESGGGYTAAESPIVVELTRALDPVAMRNPDTLQSLISGPGGMQRFIERFGGLGGAPPPPPPEEDASAPGSGGGRGGGR